MTEEQKKIDACKDQAADLIGGWSDFTTARKEADSVTLQQINDRAMQLYGEHCKNRWISINELPKSGEQILLTGFNISADKKTIWHCVGFYAGYFQVRVDLDYDEEVDNYDLCAETEEFYLKPGFYEEEESPFGPYDCVYMKRNPTHWQKLINPNE